MMGIHMCAVRKKRMLCRETTKVPYFSLTVLAPCHVIITATRYLTIGVSLTAT